ncbi:MAG: hypothetical protein QXK90_01785 [Candidatus Parvarchaeota archaeon]|nr:hypothetical protein [Candidatus Bathyarchaeota archaeon]
MVESGVEIKFEPFKEVIIMEENYFSSLDELARFTSIIAGGKPIGLYWAEGVAFIYFPLPASTEIVAKELIENKRVYWTFVAYALMSQYQPVIETKEKIIMPIINVSSNPLFRKVALWLKDQSSRVKVNV